MRDRLPIGWLVAALEDLAETPKQDIVDGPFGSDLKASSYVSSGVPIVRLQNIDRNRFLDKNIRFVTTEKAAALARHSFKTGDIIITKLGDPVGKACIVPPSVPEGIIVADVVRARIDQRKSDIRFVAHAINSAEASSQLNLEVKGSTRPRVNLRHIRALKIPIAPLQEQRRIVAKLEKLLDKVDSCQRRLANTPVLLKRFRQAVLASACSGRLTADWREKNSNTRSVDLLAEGKRYQLAEPEADLPELPETWSWVALGNYGRCMRGRFSIRPRNDPSCFGGEHPFIQIGDLPQEGGWVCSHTQTLNEKGLGVSKKFPKGTALIAIVGATIGNTGLLAYDMCFTDSIVGIETGTHDGNRYVELFLRNQKYKIRQASYSSGGQPNIKLDFLNPYPLALPPLAEQGEIVRRVDQLFSLADQIEARFAKSSQYVESLKQSILAKAFRGELVPQDPNDEPAAVLLERIREARPTKQRIVR
jgi:type I restriction enzyme S subunit